MQTYRFLRNIKKKKDGKIGIYFVALQSAMGGIIDEF